MFKLRIHVGRSARHRQKKVREGIVRKGKSRLVECMDYIRSGEKKKGKEHNKRKREERERLAEIFKKNNIMDRTSPSLKQTGEERKIKKEHDDGDVERSLLKVEMIGLKNEIKEIKGS